MNVFTKLLSWFRARPFWVRRVLVVGVLLVLCGASGAAGRWLFPRETVKETTHETVVLTTEWKAVVVTKEAEVVYKDRLVTKYIYAPDGGVAEKTVEEDKTSDSKNTETVAAGSGSTIEHLDLTTTKTTTPVADRFFAFVGVGVQPLQGASVVALLGLDVRVAGPFYGGAWSTVPVLTPQQFAVGVDLAVRFGQ